MLIFDKNRQYLSWCCRQFTWALEHHFDCEEWRGLSVARVDRPMQPSLQQSWRVANRMTLLLTLPHNPQHPKQNNRFVLPPIYWLAGWHNPLSSSRSEQPPLNPGFAPQESKNAWHLRRDKYGHFRVNMMINWWIWFKKMGKMMIDRINPKNWMGCPKKLRQTRASNGKHWSAPHEQRPPGCRSAISAP
jgi:hypothetical protein